MIIGYNLFKTKDSYILEVLADATVKFYYKDKVTDKLILSVELEANDSVPLSTSKDGVYKVILIEPITLLETIFEFRVTAYLEKSIASDAYYILVKNDYDSGCNVIRENCTSKLDRKVLKTKELFVKLLTYQFKYLPNISGTTSIIFNIYMTNAVEEYKCNVQNKINKILEDECNGNHTSSNTLFELYLVIYWAGMYFMAKNGTTDEDELAYIQSKYYYEYINNALCDLCITLEDLEVIYNG